MYNVGDNLMYDLVMFGLLSILKYIVITTNE